MFPEGGGYDLVDGYLYSDHLIWSFGSIKGTKEAAWQEKLSQISVEELCAIIRAKTEETDVILTGRRLPEELREIADEVYNIIAEK